MLLVLKLIFTLLLKEFLHSKFYCILVLITKKSLKLHRLRMYKLDDCNNKTLKNAQCYESIFKVLQLSVLKVFMDICNVIR